MHISYSIGDKVVHPMHGAGVIDDIVSKNIGGGDLDYYVLKLPVGGMLVMIPTTACEKVGVRPVCGSGEADAVISSLSDLEVDECQNWNRRYRENLLRIKSGDLNQVAQVVKSLHTRDSAKGLSTGERKMLVSAKQILISEIVLSQSSSYDEVEQRVANALS